MVFCINHYFFMRTWLSYMSQSVYTLRSWLCPAMAMGASGATITPATGATSAPWLNIVTHSLGLWLWRPSLVLKMTFSK